jgi:enoyl-CoA hydratase
MEQPSVIVGRDGRIGRLRLNRPRALNALDQAMIRRLHAALDGWRDDPLVHAVVIEGEGDRAFCAGGDVRAARQYVLDGGMDPASHFFAAEYALNQAIADYPKPYIALIDGICMGGGIGVSVHGSARVVTESAMLAMPETAIGLFPDIGASHFLPRLPGALGMFLGLTGARLMGADAVHAGLATHFVPKGRLAALSAALAAEGQTALAGFAAPLPPFTLAEYRPAIDRCFSADSIHEVFERLAAETSPWAAETLAALRRHSPSALAWSFALLRRGIHRSLPQCLAAELALVGEVTRHPDFLEGVRAVVVDKDRQPRWSPPSLEDVDYAAITALVG